MKIQKHQLKNGKGKGKLTFNPSPELMAAFEASLRLLSIPGTNVNSNRTVGEAAKQAGVEATRTKLRANYKRNKRHNVGEMHTYVASKERQDPITGEPIITETVDIGSNGSGAMSGRDPLLGTIFDLSVGTKAWNAGTKLLLWGAGKYIPSTMLGLWGRRAIIDDVVRRSFNPGGWGQLAVRPAEETSLFYKGKPQSESGLTSLKFFERPSRISERERLGIHKGENYYTPELNRTFLKQINDFAEKYGYTGLEDKEYSSELLNSYARALIDRHNKFYRGVFLPEGEDLDLIKKTLGNKATDELILLYVATHPRGKDINPQSYITPTLNAFSYGANGKTAIISRPYKLGRDRTKWFDEGDFNIVETGTVSPKSYNDFLGIVYPWDAPKFLVYNPFLGVKTIPEYYRYLTPLDIIEGNGYYEYIPNPHVQNELVAINYPTIFRLWVENPTLETLSRKTPDVPWQLSKITVRKQGGKMYKFNKRNFIK